MGAIKIHAGTMSVKPCLDADLRGEQTPVLSVLSVRNAWECGQIVLSSEDGKRREYFVETSDLLSESGEVFSAGNITVYIEKPIFVDKNWQKNGYIPGNYPDALLPYDAAVCHGENTVGKQNAGIVAEIRVPKEARAGKYTGQILIKADEDYSVEVRLEISDIVLPDGTGVRTLFHTNAQHMEKFETGDPDAVYDAYLHYLQKHYISQTEILRKYENSEAGIEAFCEKAEASVREGSSTIGIVSFETFENGVKYFDAQYFENALYALAKRSLSCGINLVAHTVFYDWIIDEPFCGTFPAGQISGSVSRFLKAVDNVLEKCARNKDFSCNYGKGIVASVSALPHIITDYLIKPYGRRAKQFDAEGKPYEYRLSEVTLCPKYDGYDEDSLRRPYKECQDVWWYGCNTPNAPYPGYHIDDAGFSPRVISWMMAQYGVRGNLYWVTNYAYEVNTTGKPLFVDDPYDTAHRGFGANGEGVIIYPGTPYGIFGPVGSYRLKQIREGHRDYDMLRLLYEEYASHGVSAEGILGRLTACLYDGAKIDSFSYSFDRVRESAIRLFEMARSDARLTVETYPEKDGVTYVVRADGGTRVFCDGEEVAETGERYTFKRAYARGKWLRLSAVNGGCVRDAEIFNGRGLKVILHETLYEKKAVTDAKELYLEEDDIRREIKVKPSDETSLKIDLGEIVSETDGLALEIRSCKMNGCTIYARGKTIAQHTLKDGWNRICCDPSRAGGSFAQLEIRFEDKVETGIGEIYLDR